MVAWQLRGYQHSNLFKRDESKSPESQNIVTAPVTVTATYPHRVTVTPSICPSFWELRPPLVGVAANASFRPKDPANGRCLVRERPAERRAMDEKDQYQSPRPDSGWVIYWLMSDLSVDLLVCPWIDQCHLQYTCFSWLVNKYDAHTMASFGVEDLVVQRFPPISDPAKWGCRLWTA